MYKRKCCDIVTSRLSEPRRFIQVLMGPRQTGKTTLASQAMELLEIPTHYVSADGVALRSRQWIEQQWQVTRIKLKDAAGQAGVLLALDEIHKVPGWSEVVKKLWDEDTRTGIPIKVLLLGSSPLLVQQGLTESLAGRFESIPVTHWSLAEMRDAFGFDLERYLYFGGYPGSAALAGDAVRWANYILDSLVETTISRDILLTTEIHYPALLRRLFQLGCDYSGQILSYTKMLGQLQEPGNTTTLAHYLDLLSGVGMVAGIQKFCGESVRVRSSSPKFAVWNTALMTAASGRGPGDVRMDPEFRGRLAESAVAAHLLNGSRTDRYDLYYWRERDREVDFILRKGKRLLAIEVKSGRSRGSFPGMEEFSRRYPGAETLLVGDGGMPLAEFLVLEPGDWWR